MKELKSLPPMLADKFRHWQNERFPRQQAHYEDLVDNGQKPLAMVISCCDSRVQPTEIFDVDAGSFFVHRNIGNLVPSSCQKDISHGTAAALEYAIKGLSVSHLIILGHSQCGGIKYFHDTCVQQQPAAFESVSAWIETLNPMLDDATIDKNDITALEQRAILLSMKNALSFPFVEQAVAAGDLSLHACWHDIRQGQLFAYNAQSDAFEAV